MNKEQLLLVKAITYRMIALATTFGVTYFYFGSLGSSIVFSLILEAMNSLVYYLYDKIWYNKILNTD
jgi:uncharacterized membrane protein